jgi:hypothetical protein
LAAALSSPALARSPARVLRSTEPQAQEIVNAEFAYIVRDLNLTASMTAVLIRANDRYAYIVARFTAGALPSHLASDPVIDGMLERKDGRWVSLGYQSGSPKHGGSIADMCSYGAGVGPAVFQECGGTQAMTGGDPASFCRMARVSDTPTRDPRYHGPAYTPSMLAALNLPDTSIGQQEVAWRCADGRVLACAELSTTGCSRAPWLGARSRAISEPIRAICRENPNVECAPGTHCIYRCRNGVASLARNAYPVDRRGFSPSEWIVIAHP